MTKVQVKEILDRLLKWSAETVRVYIAGVARRM
jgi:hypothetical protein